MSTIIDRILRRRQDRIDTGRQDVHQLMRAIGDGKDVPEAKLEAALEAAGVSAQKFAGMVSTYQHRKTLAATVKAGHEAEARRPVIQAKIQAIDEALEQARRRAAEAVAPLVEELRATDAAITARYAAEDTLLLQNPYEVAGQFRRNEWARREQAGKTAAARKLRDDAAGWVYTTEVKIARLTDGKTLRVDGEDRAEVAELKGELKTYAARVARHEAALAVEVAEDARLAAESEALAAEMRRP